jgi:hypothetical protein
MPDSEPNTQASTWPSLKGLWGLLWRSTVLLPVALLLSTVWFLIWASVFGLPGVVLLFLVFGDWLHAAELSALWVPLIFLCRWKTLRVDSKDTLDWHHGNI